MNEDAHLGIDDWLIIVGGYGAFEFRGTESEAEEMRRNKSRWEGAVAKKRRLTKRAPDVGQAHDLSGQIQLPHAGNANRWAYTWRKGDTNGIYSRSRNKSWTSCNHQ